MTATTRVISVRFSSQQTAGPSTRHPGIPCAAARRRHVHALTVLEFVHANSPGASPRATVSLLAITNARIYSKNRSLLSALSFHRNLCYMFGSLVKPDGDVGLHRLKTETAPASAARAHAYLWGFLSILEEIEWNYLLDDNRDGMSSADGTPLMGN
ncbi:hypothetical protein A0H81_03338 [Grifola frondosa]|uniref:Uncharacterized protein n=1 Tax=Grifola frondosa TaxID=5627 RepID=A0A1C7MIA4_GRIFR|nr:hypothetical protein A0H81_03338 [Grifola frondosa]